jgi:hypothetical protein
MIAAAIADTDPGCSRRVCGRELGWDFLAVAVGDPANCGGIELARSPNRAMIEGEPIPNRKGI